MLGFAIISIEQYNNDRIILIRTKKGDGEMNIILEMFGRGNFIIADNSMKITLAYQVHEFKDRAVRPGAVYNPPVNRSVDINDSEAVAKAVLSVRERNDSTIAAYLTKQIGMGSMYVEEAMRRAKIAPNTKGSAIKSAETERLSESIYSLIKECLNSRRLIVYRKDGAIIDFSLCEIGKYSGCESQEFDSMEKGLDFVYSNVREGVQVNEEAERVRASIRKQSDILAEIDREISENRDAGNYIMNNMHEINAIIQEIRASKGADAAHIKNPSSSIEILSISMKNKTARIRKRASDY